MGPLLNILLGYASAWISAPMGSGFGSALLVPESIKAPWTPPGVVFAVVWSLAFFILAFQYRSVPTTMRWLHIVLLHAWTPIFFGLAMYRASLLVIVGVFVVSLWIAFLKARQTSLQLQRGVLTMTSMREAVFEPEKNMFNFSNVFWVLFLTWLAFALSMNIYATSNAIQLGMSDTAAFSCSKIGASIGPPTRIAYLLQRAAAAVIGASCFLRKRAYRCR